MDGVASSFDVPSTRRNRPPSTKLPDAPKRIESASLRRSPVADGGSYFAVEFTGRLPKGESRVRVNVQGWDLMLPVNGGEWISLPPGPYAVYLFRGGALKTATLDLAPREALVAVFEFSRFGITWSGWTHHRVYFSGAPGQSSARSPSIASPLIASSSATAPSAPPATRTPLLAPADRLIAAIVATVLMLIMLGLIDGSIALLVAFLFCGLSVALLLRRRRRPRPAPPVTE